MFAMGVVVTVGASEKFANTAAEESVGENFCGGEILAPICRDAQILVRHP